MAGKKQFNNQTGAALNVTLYIRKSDNPANNAGTQELHLKPHESKHVTYGDSINIYLNGFSVVAAVDGDIMSRQEFVVRRGSNLDDKLNKNNIIDIVYENETFHFRGRNS